MNDLVEHKVLKITEALRAAEANLQDPAVRLALAEARHGLTAACIAARVLTLLTSLLQIAQSAKTAPSPANTDAPSPPLH